MEQIIAEFVDSYLTDQGTVNPWFTRRLKEQPEEVQKAVKKELREHGLLDEWLTDEDWDWLTDQICIHLHLAATHNLVQYCNLLLSERDPPPSKRVTARNIQPLLDRMRHIWIDYANLCTWREQLENQPTREQILAETSTEELMTVLGQRLDKLSEAMPLQSESSRDTVRCTGDSLAPFTNETVRYTPMSTDITD